MGPRKEGVKPSPARRPKDRSGCSGSNRHDQDHHHRASVIKLADKTSNLLAIAKSPPPWPKDQKRAYVDWARAVVSGLPFKPAGLMAGFEEAARLATESIEADGEEAGRWIGLND